MTVNTATNTATYTGNGATTAFAVPFYFLVNTDLQVLQKVAATGAVKTLVLNSDYTLTGAGVGAGGSLTTTVAPANGDTLYIQRNVAAVQQTAYPSNSPFPAASHEMALDRLTMLAQQIQTGLGLTLQKQPLASIYDLQGNTLINEAVAVNPADVPNLSQVQQLVAAGQSGIVPANIALLSDLASTATGKGAALIGFKQSGTGAAPRTVAAQLQDAISVKQFGAVGDGVTNDSAAIAAALAYAGTLSGGATVHFPAGTYAMASGQIIPSNTVVSGAGKFATTILLTTASMIGFSQSHATLSFSNTTVRDLSLATNVAGTVGIKFTLCSRTEISNVGFFGITQNFHLDRGQFHQITDCVASGYNSRPCGSARIWSSTDTEYCTNVSVKSYILTNPGQGNDNTADVAAIYIRRGVSVFVSHFYTYDLTLAGGGAYQNGIVIENDSQGCKISDSCIVVPNVGVVLQQGSGIVAAPYCTTLLNVDVDQSATNAYELAQCTYTTIVGGFVTPVPRTIATTAIVLYSGALYTTVTGTMVFGLSGTNGCAFTFNGCSYVTVENCQIDTCYYGFNFNGQTHAKIFHTTLRNCSNKFTGTPAGVGNAYVNNEGFNALTVAAPGMVATGVPYTNSLGVRCTVFVAGGTIAGIYINGILTGLTSGAFDLAPNETIQINYTGTPTWTWIGH